MAKNRNRRRSPAAAVPPPLDLLTADMRRHVAELGIPSLTAYFEWCRQHGFTCSLDKPGLARRREIEYARSLGGSARLAAHERVRNPAEAVQRLLDGEAPASAEHHAVAVVLRDSCAPAERRALLAHVLRHLAAVLPGCLRPSCAGLGIALHMAEHWPAALRPVVDWRPRTHNERRALGSFVAHVFARYEAPPWLLDAWFATDPSAALHRRWYLHVVAGNSLRTAPGLPLPLTKRMAHECMRAPAGLTVSEALRFGQVRGLGGTNRLATAIVATRLGSAFAHDDFWRTFVLFCVRHRVDDAGRVTAMVDFVHEHRHGAGVVVDERGRRSEMAPLHPGLSMHGRTPESLQKQIDAWHGRLGTLRVHDAHVRWPASGVVGYCSVTDAGEPGECTWQVRELCTALELRRESAIMRHCAQSYVARCQRGETAIFALTWKQGERTESIATIEVRGGKVVQARGRANRALTAAAREHVRRWAQAAALPISSWV
jgi:hypothetical protein